MTSMAIPKYIEISGVLRRRCQELQIGTRLSPERALAAEFGVSVMTIRHALATLVDEGWVSRAAGSGTFATRPTVAMGPSLTSFTQDMGQRGFTPSSQVLRLETVAPDLETIARLGLRPGERAVFLERLRFADNEPMCHEQSLLPERLAPALHAGDLTESLHAALREHGTIPRSTERSVRAVVASQRECELLELPPGSPALEITDVFFDSFGQAMQYARSRYRFDRYEVRTNIENAVEPDGQSPED